MNIHIIGAGAVGLSTALALAREGHQVTVLESRTGAAQGASFAPSGLHSSIPPALWPATSSWHGPRQTSGFPAMPLSFLDLSARNWNKARHKAHARCLESPTTATSTPTFSTDEASHPTEPLAEDAIPGTDPSPQPTMSPAPEAEHEPEPSLTVQLARQMRIDHEYEHASGHLIVATDNAQLRRLQQLHERLLRQQASGNIPGSRPVWLEADGLAALEPGLSPDAKAKAALQLPADDVGNCRQMAMAIRTEAARLGVQFHFNTTVARLESLNRNGNWRLHLTSGQTIDTSWLVLCASESVQTLLRPLGCKLPLQAAHGYTLTANLREPLHAPRHAAFTDLGRQVSITRQGQRIRVSGGYRLGPQPRRQDDKAIQALYHALGQWFPGAALLDGSAQTWSATVWMTPDDEPIIGPAPQLAGIWLNVGHGFNGWANSLPSADRLARQFST